VPEPGRAGAKVVVIDDVVGAVDRAAREAQGFQIRLLAFPAYDGAIEKGADEATFEDFEQSAARAVGRSCLAEQDGAAAVQTAPQGGG